MINNDYGDITNITVITADISNCNVENATIDHLVCQYADIMTALIGMADISDCIISNASIETASIHHADISNAVINYADIMTALIGMADISDCIIQNASIQNASIQVADISSCTINNLEIENLLLTDIQTTATILAIHENKIIENPNVLEFGKILSVDHNGYFKSSTQTIEDLEQWIVDAEADANRADASVDEAKSEADIIKGKLIQFVSDLKDAKDLFDGVSAIIQLAEDASVGEIASATTAATSTATLAIEGEATFQIGVIGGFLQDNCYYYMHSFF